MPSRRPPTNAIGIERKPANATAAREPRTISVNWESASWNSGAIRMPPSPASTMVNTQAADEVRAALTPRSPARSPRSTTARISSPRRVWRNTSQRPIAASNATTNTATWSELRITPLEMKSRWYTSRWKGPMPRTALPVVPDPLSTGRSSSSTRLPNASTVHSASTGSAISRPMVPTIRA